MQRNVRRIIAIVLAALLAGSVLFGVFNNIIGAQKASAITKDDINNRKKQIEELKSQKKEIESEMAEAQAVIDGLETQEVSAMNMKAYLDAKISVIEEEIDNITAQINLYDELINNQHVVVDEAVEIENAQWTLYEQRLRTLEEDSRVSYLSVLLDADSFSDLLARMDFIREIMKSDEEIYDKLVEARAATEAEKAELERLQDDAQEQQTELQSNRILLEEELLKAQELIDEVEADLDLSREMYEAKQAEEDEIQRQIQEQNEKLLKEQAQYDAQVAAEKAAAAAAAARSGLGSARGTGSLIWPSSYSNYLTSLFGNRFHPIAKEWRYHSGIDIAGSGISGTSVLAADSGTVITSTYGSGYGNYIVISHGNGMTTLYGHLSKRNVSAGQTVSKGQVIGLVGSTGLSTGPHLHFEVSVNGVRKDPLSYFYAGSYVISPNA